MPTTWGYNLVFQEPASMKQDNTKHDRRHGSLIGLPYRMITLLGLFVLIFVLTPAFAEDLMYKNNYPHDNHGLSSLLKWQLTSAREGYEDIEFPLAQNDPGFLKSNHNTATLTWIGHASFLIQIDGLNILTDPHLSQRASPLSWAGPARYTPPGLDYDDLPQIDIVVISHNHYDHLDAPTIKELNRRQPEQPPHYFVPMGNKDWFADRGIDDVTELDWWQSAEHDGIRLTAAPVQHFSGRGLTDKNETLWCGWILNARASQLFFAGDTGYSRDFADIHNRAGPMDLSLIPIGAYEPRWFMQAMHVNPEEAVQIHQDLKSRFSVGMHWGTFRLTDEPHNEPPARLTSALKAARIPGEQFFVMQHGETRMLDDILR